MAEVKWIKITTDIFDDEKMLLIESMPDAYAIITVWFKLLCLAGKMNNSGVFIMSNRIAYTDKMLATIFRMNESTVSLALNAFEQFGMIEIIDGVITIPNWGKHQNLDQLENKREYMKNYMANYREKQKQISCKTNCKTNSKTNVSSLDKDKDIDIDKDKDIKEKNIKKKSAFVPPTVEEVANYCKERGNNVDAESFVAFYDSKNWMVGKNKMASWKSAIITWEKRDKSYNNTNNKNVDFGFVNKPIINRDVDMEGLF